MSFKNYKVWMIQEGREKEDLIEIICEGCGKVLSESSDFWSDVDGDGSIFCTKKCSQNPTLEFVNLQQDRFAIEAAKEFGFIK